MSVQAIEDALVARLVATVQAAGLVRQVYAQADYAVLPETSLVTPSLAVIYTGYAPGPKAAAGIQSVIFNWLAVVNVRNARQTASGAGQRADASPIIDATLAALLGFRPLPKFKPLELEAGPGAATSDAGFGYYPLAFSTTGTYRGTTT